MNATENLLRLIDFAVAHGLVEDIDRSYTLNRLLEAMQMSAPEAAKPCQEPLPSTVTPMLTELTALAAEKGIIADTNGAKELFAAKLCGEITPAPAVVRRKFRELYDNQGPRAATEWVGCRDRTTPGRLRNSSGRIPTQEGSVRRSQTFRSPRTLFQVWVGRSSSPSFMYSDRTI